MSIILSLFLVAPTYAQSLVPSVSSDSRTNTCVRRTVGVYTTGSSTYIVSNLGSTSFPAQPSLCANVSTSTVATTVTVFESAAPTPTVVTDAGFENGEESPFNTSSSDPSVTAEVAQSGGTAPLQPYSGDSFLLITFNNTTLAPPRIKRQAAAPQVYNVTQNFAAVAGTSYKLSAYAAQAQNGATALACSITICGDNTCGASTALTTSYSPYSYQYNAGVTNAGATATFSVSCPQSAYVALDNVTVTAGGAAAASLSPITTTIIQYVTRTQSIQGATQIETTRQIEPPSTQVYSVTNTVSTVLWSTATVVISVPQTEYLSVNVTISELSTTTTTITRTLEQTTTINQPPSLIAETASATTTALVTQTDYPVSLLSATPATYTTNERTTLEITTTLAGVTQTPPAETQFQYSTSVDYSTAISTILLSVTLPQATQSVPYTLPQATESVTLPQVTYTPQPETTYITVTLPASTITSYISVTPPPMTEYQTLTATAPTSTLQITETLPALTTVEIQTQTRTLDQETLRFTETTNLPASTLRFTETTSLPAQTLGFTDTTSLPAQTLRFTDTTSLPAQTLRFTDTTSLRFTDTTSLPGQTIIQTLTLSGTTLTQTLTLGQSTTRTTTTTTSTTRTTTTTSTTSTTTTTSTIRTTTTTTTTSSSSTGPPSVALADPTNIAGNANTGATRDYDDEVFPVTLPFAVSLYGQSNANVVVTTNGLLGLGSATDGYDNTALPAYVVAQNGVFAMWKDLYIFSGSKQGIYYQVSGTTGSRTAAFEFYLSYIADRNQYYHFLITFFENRPNVVTLKYLDVTDRGTGSTVGVEGAGNKFKQYSFNQAIIYPGLQLTFDTSPANGNGIVTVDNPGTP